MLFTVACATCDRPLRVRDHYRGKAVRCPGCDTPFIVPETDPAPSRGVTWASTGGSESGGDGAEVGPTTASLGYTDQPAAPPVAENGPPHSRYPVVPWFLLAA